MEKTKAQIVADKLYPAPSRSNYHTDTEYESVLLQYEVNKLIWLDGYNAATLKWRKIQPNSHIDGEFIVFPAILNTSGRYLNGDTTDRLLLFGYTHYIPISDLLQLPKED